MLSKAVDGRYGNWGWPYVSTPTTSRYVIAYVFYRFMRSFSDRVAALKSRTSKIKSTSADGECMGGERENRGMKTGGESGQQVLLNHSAGWVGAGGAIKYL